MQASARKTTLAGCCAVHGLQDGLTSSVNVLLPILAQHFALSYAQVGMVRATHSAAMFLFELPSGFAAERFGERRPLIFGLLCGGLGYLGMALSPDYAILICALFLTGLGAAFQHSLNSALVSKVFDTRDRPVALGTYNSAGDVGKLCATAALSFGLGLGIAWQPLVAGYGVVALATAAGIWLLFRRLGVGDAPDAPATHPESTPVKTKIIRDQAGFAALSMLTFLDTLVQDGFLVFIAFLMIEKAMSPDVAAFAIVLTLSGGVVGKLGCGFLARRLGTVPAFILVEVLTAIGILAVYWSPGSATFWLLPIVGIVLQGSSTISYGTVGVFVSETQRSRGFGIIYTMTSIASVLGPIAYGFIGDRFGIGAAMLAMAGTVLLTLPVCAALAPALRRVRD